MRSRFALLGAFVASALMVCAELGADDSLSRALDKAVAFFQKSQNPDGGFGPYGDDARVENASDAGITAFVLYAVACHPRQYKEVDGPLISRAVEFLLSKQQPDGGFYDPRDPVLKNYRTSVALMALSKLDRVRYADAIRKAKDFIVSGQRDERSGHSGEEHLPFGSVGHSGSMRGDLSNAAFAAEAVREAGLSASEPFWKKLEVFVARCQNHPEVDPLVKKSGIGTTGDYGFRYAPNDTRGPKETLDDGSTVFSSYGSMTYQGLKSLLYANVDRDDPRVRGAFAWISKNFTVRENPGMSTRADPRAGLQGLFYYYHTMAKTLAAYGEPVVVDARGVEHNWARELSEHLVSIQKSDGSWVNGTGRWWEDLPTLDTAYALIALSTCRDELARQEKAGGTAEPAKPSGRPGSPAEGAGSGR